MTRLIIAAVNLQSGVGTTRGYWEYPLTGWKYWLPHSSRHVNECAAMIKREQIDIACVTEITESSLRSAFRSQTGLLQRQSGLQNAHFFSSQMAGKFLFHEGNAVLSNYPLSGFASHLMPIEMMRIALEESVITVEGVTVTVFIGHLALGKKMRLTQLEMIIGVIQQRSGPIIFAGDFNEPDPETFNDMRTRTTVKQLFVEKCRIPAGPAFSDHVPLIVEADLR